MNNIQMLSYDRINVSEGTDFNDISASKECNICHYWYFLDKGFKFQSYVCNRRHDLVMIFMNLSDRAILNITGSDCRCNVSGISKSEAINFNV